MRLLSSPSPVPGEEAAIFMPPASQPAPLPDEGVVDDLHALLPILLIEGRCDKPDVFQPLSHLPRSSIPMGWLPKSSRVLRRLPSGIPCRSSPRLTSSVRARRAASPSPHPGQALLCLICPLGQASGDTADGRVGFVGEIALPARHPQLSQGKLQQWLDGAPLGSVSIIL